MATYLRFAAGGASSAMFADVSGHPDVMGSKFVELLINESTTTLASLLLVVTVR
jgi:hypothetical protein